METIKVRGLAHLSAWMFGVWGAMVSLKGVYDLFGGQPESNLYAPAAWAFVTKAQWFRYSSFELVYGLICLAVAWTLAKYSAFLPDTLRRKRVESKLDLFN